uniref:regulator of nonsense transcripts 1 homolog n=1 Tax=Erigeron canadensis TaxID=72917 RepID=UPI001CB8FF28|nr:regulator of nonsense transcripts 1 homolog [Erigeron canadensis]
MEAEGGGRVKKKKDEFLKIIFPWSLDDILNQNLYKNQVDKIPLTFDSEQQYFSSFVYPLLEETRAELASSLENIHRYPSAHILSIHEATRDGEAVYDVKVGPWRNTSFERGKLPYQTLPGDLFIFMHGKAESVSDLQRMGRTWAFSLVSKIKENDNEDDFEATPSRFTVKASQPVKFQDGMFVVFLKNIKIQTRIWDSLHMNGNMNIIKAVLDPHSMVKENCNTCSFDFDSVCSLDGNPLDMLNESQRAAVMVSLVKTECCHNSYVEQIWGPPGTGKTTTVSVLLFVLLQMNRRTLTCAPTNIALLQLASRMLSLVKESSKTTTANENLVSKDLEHLFTSKPLPDELENMSLINSVRAKSISILRGLQISLEVLGLPDVVNRHVIVEFCFERASLIFCTTSSSYKLHMVPVKPLNILVIDEAAQLKEAESTIPLQLHGIKHAILIGDECQLPAMVTSNVCIESGFGRSLFDRLSYACHSRHLLNVQYRMHPSISFFPNWRFYQNQILDAENVLCESYENRYLSGPMFGSYSFINIVGGREEKGDDGQSKRNMVEVAIVMKIVKSLYKVYINTYDLSSLTFIAWKDSKKKLTIGVVSPYAAQVVTIQEKLAHKYEKLDGFSVKVKSIDEFQGGEEDVIILSTVRSNSHGSTLSMDFGKRKNPE